MLPMHLMVPHAGLPPTLASAGALPDLPNLQQLLACLTPMADAQADPDDGNEKSLSPPHERVLARLRQWPVVDGLLPFAALAAAGDGLQDAVDAAGPGLGWGLLRPTYWHLGTDRVALVDPAELQLTDAESKTLFAAVAGLFDSDGWALHWGAATRWYAVHTSLRLLPTAAVDRVVGRNIDLWLAAHPQARALQRLQSEVQMSLHDHPVNRARVQAGLAPVNSFWLSGTGATRTTGANRVGGMPGRTDAVVDIPGLQVEQGLRRAAMAADAAGWMAAWAPIDGGAMQHALMLVECGQELQLTLCGERSSLSFTTPRRPRWRRLIGRQPLLRDVLGAL